jgi:spermidine synthase
MAAYPGGSALLATHSLDTPVLGLVAREDGERFQLDPLRARLADAKLPRPLADFGINDDLALLGSFVAGPRALRRFASTSAPNTDDHPVVAYLAPRITYVPEALPRDRLMAVLGELGVEPGELVDAGQDTEWATRMAAYREARNHYLDVGRSVRPSPDVHQMLAQVQEPLLSVLRLSPEFRPAYDPLLRMARTLGHTDAAAARALLSELAHIQPARPEAAEALRQPATAQP